MSNSGKACQGFPSKVLPAACLPRCSHLSAGTDLRVPPSVTCSQTRGRVFLVVSQDMTLLSEKLNHDTETYSQVLLTSSVSLDSGRWKKWQLGGGSEDHEPDHLEEYEAERGELRLLMLGLDNAGKTTISKKFSPDRFGSVDRASACGLKGPGFNSSQGDKFSWKDIDTTSQTLGFSINTLEHRGFKLNIWDVEQESLRSYWQKHSENSSSCLGGGQHRLPDCQQEPLAGGTLILANRQDLPGALSSSATREALELDSVCSHHWRIRGCSTGTRDNLLPSIDWLLDDLSRLISWPTEPRQVPLPCSLLPHPPTQALSKHHPWRVGISQPNEHFLSPFMTCCCCPLLLHDQPRSHGRRAVALAPDPASPPAGLGLGGGCLCYQGWASSFAQL
ncbi:hypothetical protein QTO34_013871 [Cnephaeus nilssonii]|uniref:Uncharacterized protein n=1 Tax=Cnephaeus nilssonii TaxID=3371016 RepID=A0AA40I930_CNENI|nr:hypothetical protein QTO34_013871 [Eptesicus nilssonii]